MAAPNLSLKVSAMDILQMYEERRAEFASRNGWYDILETYYQGGPVDTGGPSPVWNANAQGRPMLRDRVEASMSRSPGGKSTYRSHRLAPVVEDYAGLIGRMPTSRVDDPDGSEQGQQKAEKLTKYLYSTYEMSNMVVQQAQAGHWLSKFGDACYVLDPYVTGDKADPMHLRVVWTAVNPINCYPKFYKGFKRFEIYDLLIAEVLSPRDIAISYRMAPYSDEWEDCIVLTYVSPYQRTIVVGSKKGRAKVYVDAEWDLKFCPAVWVFNKVTGSFGMSDIGHSLSQQDMVDWGYSVMADGYVQTMFGAIVGIKNPNEVGQDIEVGPGAAPIPLGPEGDIIVRNVGGDIRPAMQMMGQVLDDMNASTGSSQVRQEGQIESSIITGKAVSAVQGPQSTRIEAKQDVIADAWRRLNSMTLAMQERAPHLRDWAGDIYGRYKGRSFKEQMSAVDIDGWYRNTVTWQALIGMNPLQRAQYANMGKQAKLWDDTHAMEIVGIDDPLMMRDKIESMTESEMQQQARGQALMQQAGIQPPQEQGPPKGGGAPGAGKPPPNPGAKPAPMMMEPPPTAQAPPPPPLQGGVPQGASRKAIQAALEAIADTLKGSVWALADLALGGQATQIKLAVSDFRDKTKVIAAVKGVAQNASVDVRAIAEDKLPPEAVRLV